MRHFCFLFLSFFLAVSFSLAQSNSLSNIDKIDFKNIQVLKNGEEIIGYSAFYKTKTEEDKSSYYQLTILDKDLNTRKTVKLSEDKSLYLLDMQYNLELMCFKFYDSNTKRVVFKLINKKGDLLATKNYSVDLYAGQLISLAIKEEVKMDPSLYPVNGVGFLNYRWVKHDKPGYEIRFYPNSLEDHSWTFRSNASSTMSEFATLLTANKEVVVNLISIQKAGLYKETAFEVSVLKTSTGKELSRTKISSNEFEESILNAFYDEVKKEVKLIGMYYKKGVNILTSPSLGMVVSTIGADGKVKNKRNYEWKGEIAELLPSDTLNNEDGSIYFHRIMKQDDGSILALGESFSQVKKGISLTTKVLPSSNLGSNAQYSFDFISGNFYLFKFNSDFRLNSVELIKRKATGISLPAGAATYGMHFMSLYSNLMGGFSLNHFQYFDNSNFRFFYSRASKENEQYFFYGMVSVEEGALKQFNNSSEINNDISAIKALPFDSTKLVLFTYKKDQKQLMFEVK